MLVSAALANANDNCRQMCLVDKISGKGGGKRKGPPNRNTPIRRCHLVNSWRPPMGRAASSHYISLYSIELETL